MKKIISILVALIILCSNVCAAPYRNVFYNQNLFSRNMIEFALGDFSFEVKDVPVSEIKKEKPVHRTMESVTASICVAKTVSKAMVGGEDVLKVTFYTGGSDTLRECYFTDSSYTKGGAYTYKNITSGSIFYIGVNDENYVTSYAVVSVVNSQGIPVVDITSVSANLLSPKVKCVSSYIKDYKNKNGNTVLELTNGDVYVVGDKAFTYTFDNSKKTTVVYTDSFLGSNVDRPYFDESVNKSEVYPVVAFLWDDEIAAICSYGKSVYVNGNLE